MSMTTFFQNKIARIGFWVCALLIFYIVIDYLWQLLLALSIVQPNQEYSGKRILRYAIGFFVLAGVGGWFFIQKRRKQVSEHIY